MERRACAMVAWALGAVVVLSAPALGPSAHAATRVGSAVVVMTIGDFTDAPELAKAVPARFVTVNTRGGVVDARGVRHLVKVRTCDTRSDPAQSEACAHQAVERRVTAVIGLASANSDRIWPILEAAGIPAIGSRLDTVTDGSSAVAFPLGSGAFGVFRGMPQVLAAEGAHVIATLVSDFGDANPGTLAGIAEGIRAAGATAGPVVVVPLGVLDLTPYVREATATGVDGIVVFLAGTTRTRLPAALAGASYRGKVVTAASLLGTTPSAAVPDGAFVVGEFAPLTADIRGTSELRHDLLAFDPSISLSEGAVGQWLAARVFEQAVRSATTVDAKAVLAAVSAADGFDTRGLTPPFRAQPPPGAPIPRLFNPTISVSQLHGASVRSVDQRFFDVLTGDYD